MLSTNELKEYICREIQSKLGNLNYNTIFFAEGTARSPEGTYVFSKNNKYHVLFTEKGSVRKDLETNKEREVLWNVLEILSFSISLDYATKNREKGIDYRRLLFAKEKEIFSLFGEDFKKRKDAEIRDILTRNPYNDI